MISKIFKNKKLITLCLVFAALFLSYAAAFPGDGGCEMGLVLCWIDYMSMPDMAVFYCGLGYVFCKKYVEA